MTNILSAIGRRAPDVNNVNAGPINLPHPVAIRSNNTVVPFTTANVCQDDCCPQLVRSGIKWG